MHVPQIHNYVEAGRSDVRSRGTCGVEAERRDRRSDGLAVAICMPSVVEASTIAIADTQDTATQTIARAHTVHEIIVDALQSQHERSCDASAPTCISGSAGRSQNGSSETSNILQPCIISLFQAHAAKIFDLLRTDLRRALGAGESVNKSISEVR